MNTRPIGRVLKHLLRDPASVDAMKQTCVIVILAYFTLYQPNFTPTKRSNAQHLVEYKKQLLYEENQKLGNVMQQPIDSWVWGINTSSESILIRSYLLLCAINTFLSNSGTPILRQM